VVMHVCLVDELIDVRIQPEGNEYVSIVWPVHWAPSWAVAVLA